MKTCERCYSDEARYRLTSENLNLAICQKCAEAALALKAETNDFPCVVTRLEENNGHE
jgi:hypothetical protein